MCVVPVTHSSGRDPKMREGRESAPLCGERDRHAPGEKGSGREKEERQRDGEGVRAMPEKEKENTGQKRRGRKRESEGGRKREIAREREE